MRPNLTVTFSLIIALATLFVVESAAAQIPCCPLHVAFATSASIGVSNVAPEDPTVPYLCHAGTNEPHNVRMEA